MSSSVLGPSGRVRGLQGIGALAVIVAAAGFAACGGKVASGTYGSSTGGENGSGGQNGSGGSSGQNGSSGPSGSGGQSASGGIDQTPPCTGGPTLLGPAVGRGLRRLSTREYNNVVHDLLGDTTQPANQFGAEVYDTGYDNGSVGLSVNEWNLADFEMAAETLAASAVATQLPTLIGNCDPTQNQGACVQAFLSTFAPKAYRRPLTATEQQRLQAVYAAGAAPTGMNGGGFKGGLQLMLEGVLESPSFLYREELGGAPTTAGVVTLTDYEVASELSFLFTGSMPDAELFAAAQNGKLKTVTDYSREVTRLLALPAAKPALRRFANLWMESDRLAFASKDPTIYPNSSPALGASMAAELDQYFDQVFWAGTGSLRELFTSTQGFVDSNLAPIYGVPAPAGPGLQLVSLDGQTRQGILTRAGWLAAHSDYDTSGPVVRGTFIMQAMLCAPPGSPPPNVPPSPAASDVIAAKMTTRQAFEKLHLGGVGLCVGCHTAIDGIGYGFEEFDGLGVYRTTENGQPIDDSGNLAVLSDIDGPFNGATQLESKLLGSKQVLGCFVTQVYRDAMGQEETAAAAPTLAKMQACFTVDSHITDAFAALVRAPAFVLRTAAP